MTSTRNPDTATLQTARDAQLEHMEAELARIVGPQGTQALLARSRHLCGEREPSHTLLVHTLLHLVRKLLGQPLAQWLTESAPPRVQTAYPRLR